MAIDSGALNTISSRRNEHLVQLMYLCRRLAPVRWLILLICFHLVFSFAYILYFANSFNLGKRVVTLHISIILCLIATFTICLGSFLLFRPVREWRPTRFLFALVFAIGFSLLIILYFADYIGNALWGNNINYELAAQYLLGKGIFQKELFLLPGKYYLLLAGGLIAVFSGCFWISGSLFKSLEELFSPGRPLSVYRDRHRIIRSVPSMFIGILLFGFIAFESTRVAFPYRDRVLLREPIVSFFVNPNGVNDFISYSKHARLEGEEQKNRAAYPRGQSFDKKNVVLIMVDSLRADHMGVYGYQRQTTPFLTSLLKSGHLKKVETAMSNCADTNCGVMATLSSKNLAKQIPETFKLPDLLQGEGYNLYFILGGSHRWYNLKDAYGTNLTYYYDGTGSTRYDWNDDRVISEGLDGVPAFSGVPSFFYFHLMSAHSTGVKQDEYRKYLPAKNWIEYSRGEFDSVSITNYYDNGIVQADATIEKIFQSLNAKGYFKDSLIVILADHGEALGEPDHSYYGHVNYLYQECIRIPLLIYDEGTANYANLKYATQVDVAPTVLDRLGLSIPASWQGQSLLRSDSRAYTILQTRIYPPSYAVVYKSDHAVYKYLKHPALGEELYELESDPTEKHNLIGTIDPEIIKNMRSKLEASLSEE